MIYLIKKEILTDKGSGYEYYLKDHLGSVRAVVKPNASSSPVVTQWTDYDPWGWELPALSSVSSLTTNRGKFNGKESLIEFGIGLLDFGARVYDATIGRWGVIDPLAEVSRRWSPYVYGYNNPVRFVDPDGMEAQDTKTTTEYTYSDGYSTQSSRTSTASLGYEGVGVFVERGKETSNSQGDPPGNSNRTASLSEKKAERDKRVYNAINNYGSSFKERFLNPKAWIDLALSQGAFEEDPSIVKAEAPALVEFIGPGGAIKGIKSLQVGLRNRQVALEIMSAMKSGTFDYKAARGIIGGFVDSKGIYYVSEGNHRMAAAMEIMRTTGDAGPLMQLISNGRWTTVASPVIGARPLPALDWMGKFRNWIGF